MCKNKGNRGILRQFIYNFQEYHFQTKLFIGIKRNGYHTKAYCFRHKQCTKSFEGFTQTEHFTKSFINNFKYLNCICRLRPYFSGFVKAFICTRCSYLSSSSVYTDQNQWLQLFWCKGCFTIKRACLQLHFNEKPIYLLCREIRDVFSVVTNTKCTFWWNVL